MTTKVENDFFFGYVVNVITNIQNSVDKLAWGKPNRMIQCV